MARRYVGIDLGKRRMEVCMVEGKKLERHGLTTDRKGRQMLINFLRKDDLVGYEVCSYGNRLARALEKEVGCEVPLPSEEEEGFRSDISMKEFLKRERVAAINRLHALYGQVGIIDVTKKDMQDSEGRKARHGELPPELAGYASILEEQLELFEKQLEGAEKKVAEQVRRHELAPYIMSIPGIGIGIAGCCWPIWGTGAGLANPDRWPIMRGWRRGWIVRGKRSGTVQ